MIQDPLPFDFNKEPMTYDQLLDYLREHEEYWTSLRATRWAKVPAFNALRAVVELCKFAGNGSMITPELIIQTIRAELR